MQTTITNITNNCATTDSSTLSSKASAASVVFDLHSHSHFSDGALSPEALVERAAEQGVNVLALTDHDTLDGIAEFKHFALAQGLKPVTGVELTTQWKGMEIHIVGLNFDEGSAVLQAFVLGQQRRRIERAKAFGEKLAKCNISHAYEQACGLSKTQFPGRVHFAQVLVARNIVRAKQQAFDKYLGQGKKCFVKTQWPTLEDTVLVLKQARGISVLAHPCAYKMTRTKMRALIDAFVKVGGQGIEVVSGNQDKGETEMLMGLAQQYGLDESIGSDFHYPSPWLNLGCVKTPENIKRPVWRGFSSE